MKAIIKVKIYKHGAIIKWKKKYFIGMPQVLTELKRDFNEITMDDVEKL